jgi:hypothetical protein
MTFYAALLAKRDRGLSVMYIYIDSLNRTDHCREVCCQYVDGQATYTGLDRAQMWC